MNILLSLFFVPFAFAGFSQFVIDAFYLPCNLKDISEQNGIYTLEVVTKTDNTHLISR